MNIHTTIGAMNPETPLKKESFLKEIIKFTLIAVAIVIPVRLFIAQPFIVSGASMDPTFSTGQYLIVDQVTYQFDAPERFDVIIFKYPRDPETFFIKRIIGLPGETLKVVDGVVTVTSEKDSQGLVLPDSFVIEEHKTYETFTITLGDDEYFVMGDNRSQSSDSRAWGPLEEKYIVGRPLVRLLPASKISFFPGN